MRLIHYSDSLEAPSMKFIQDTSSMLSFLIGCLCGQQCLDFVLLQSLPGKHLDTDHQPHNQKFGIWELFGFGWQELFIPLELQFHINLRNGEVNVYYLKQLGRVKIIKFYAMKIRNLFKNTNIYTFSANSYLPQRLLFFFQFFLVYKVT